jgi:hypothetical protein
MKQLLIMIIGFAGIQSCAQPGPISNTVIIGDSVLLQETRNWSRYIYLTKDKAYYVRREKGKPDHFTDHDTLTFLNDCNCYLGKHTRLQVKDKSISLEYLNGRDSGKTLFFSVTTEKQIQTWNSYYNIDRFRSVSAAYERLLLANNTRPDYYKMIKGDWARLMTLCFELNQTDFETELNSFRKKYSIP